MTSIIQLELNDLEQIVKKCLSDALKEVIAQPAKSEKIEKCDITEVSEITGLRKSAIYKLTMMDSIPHLKFGKRLVFNRSEVEAWLNERTVRKNSPDEIATLALSKAASKKLRKLRVL